MARPFNSSVYKTVVVTWLTLSIASVVLAAATWLQLSLKLAAARHATAVQASVQRVLGLAVDCESGERGFVITGDDGFLEPWRTGHANLTVELDHLVELAQQDTQMLKRVSAVRGGIEVLLDRFAHVIDMRRTRGFSAAEAIIGTGETKKMLDKLRADLEQIRQMPADLVSDAGTTARAQLRRASLTSLVAGTLGIGAGVFAFWLSRLMLQQKEREHELIEAKLQAERRSQEKTDFLANMSHEIRTPMNSILGFSELLETELSEPKRGQYLKSIRSSAALLLQLINDILDLSKIEAGVMALRLEPTDPREMCQFIQTVFRERVAKKSVKLECQVEEDFPRALLLDRIRLRQVLVNLVGNAVKFTDQGIIHVRVNGVKEDSSGHITLIIEVQDTGVGIPPDKLECIFKPFVQAGAHRDKEKHGTGLGLSIVKRLTEMMGGTVTAASVVGQGAVFRLRFPHTAISARLAAGEQKRTEDAQDFNELEPATVLIVDDNEENCELLAGMFADSHHKLAFGANGLEAVGKARALRPSLILLDVRMPGMDGREALAEIRESPGLELVPVIAVTASALREDENRLRKKFNGYLRKPFSKHELFIEVSQFLARRAGTGPGAEGGGPSSATDSAAKAPFLTPPELGAELRRLSLEEWPAIRDGLAINATKAFAQKLERLAGQWTCPALFRYAQTLARHADNLEVVELEQQLHEFSSFLEQFSQPAPE
jgi:signal transduction histidine kinase/CheY-like chemotaxis protein